MESTKSRSDMYVRLNGRIFTQLNSNKYLFAFYLIFCSYLQDQILKSLDCKADLYHFHFICVLYMSNKIKPRLEENIALNNGTFCGKISPPLLGIEKSCSIYYNTNNKFIASDGVLLLSDDLFITMYVQYIRTNQYLPIPTRIHQALDSNITKLKKQRYTTGQN